MSVTCRARHDVAFLHDQEILTINLDFGAGPLAEQHLVALLHIERDDFSGFVAGAGTDGDDFALLRLLAGGVGNDDATGRLGLGVGTLDDHAVVEGTELHVQVGSRWGGMGRRGQDVWPEGLLAASTREC